MASQKARAGSSQAKGGTPRSDSARGATATRPAGNGKAGSNGKSGSRSNGKNGSSGRSGSAAVPPGQVQRNQVQRNQASPAPGVPVAAATRAARPAPSTWFQLATLALSLFGLGVSIYLTIAHYTSSSILVCSGNGLIDCAKVTTSAESMVFGIFPVAVLGLAFYVFMVAVNTPWAWRSPLPLLWWARLGGIITGMGFVLYLLYAEIIQIGNVCLWCTSVHVITFLLFAMLVFDASLGRGAMAKVEATTRAVR